MCSPLPKFYIFWAVIKSVAIDMMSNLYREQLPSKFLFQNYPMLVSPSPSRRQFNLPVRILSTPNNSPRTNRFCSRMLHTTVGLADVFFMRFRVSWFMKTFLALARIPICLSILTWRWQHGFSTNTAGLTYKFSHSSIIYQRRVEVNA